MVGLNFVVKAFIEGTLIDLVYFSSEKFGRGGGPVHIDYINCTGSEGSIWRRCKHLSHHHGCSHEEDVGVQCKPGQIYSFYYYWIDEIVCVCVYSSML